MNAARNINHGTRGANWTFFVALENHAGHPIEHNRPWRFVADLHDVISGPRPGQIRIVLVNADAGILPPVNDPIGYTHSTMRNSIAYGNMTRYSNSALPSSNIECNIQLFYPQSRASIWGTKGYARDFCSPCRDRRRNRNDASRYSPYPNELWHRPSLTGGCGACSLGSITTLLPCRALTSGDPVTLPCGAIRYDGSGFAWRRWFRTIHRPVKRVI